MPDHVFLRRRFSSESSATNSFKSRISWRRPLTSPEVAWRPVSPASRFLPASKTLSTSCNTDPRRCPRGGTRRRCSPRRAGPTPRSGSSPQPYNCLRVLRRISRTVRSAGSFLLIDFCLIFVPFGHYDEPEILRYAITSICPKGADVRHIEKDWRGLDTMSPDFPAAVIASEDNTFCRHDGFDWDEIEKAVETYESGGRLRAPAQFHNRRQRTCFCGPAAASCARGSRPTWR